MWEFMLFIITTVVLPVVINKSTESERFEWIKANLRPIWTLLLGFYLVYFLNKPWPMEVIMEWHRRWVSTPIYGYILFSIIGAVVFALFWHLTGRMLEISTDKNKQSNEKPMTLEQKKLPKAQEIAQEVIKGIPPQITSSEHPQIRFPLVDAEIAKVKSEPPFEHLKAEFAYDIIIHNKSDVTISNINVTRNIDSEKNRQKIALRQLPHGRLKYFNKHINVLGKGEAKKINREHSPSYEYMILTIIYEDDLGKKYKCIFEGDRDGLRLKEKTKIDKTRE